MKNDRLLDLDVRLLLLRYGRRRLLSALAKIIEQSPEQLELQLQALLETPTMKPTKAPSPSAIEVATSEFCDRAEIRELLRHLAISFENRTFLPNLRDVRQFLERHGGSSQKFRSRAAAGPVLVRVLSKLPPDELARLAERNESSGDSDYELLSRAIMGKPPAEKGDSEPK